MDSALRTVSVIVPCRNESAHIDNFLDAALAQQLPPPWTLQLLVADGASDDGTRARLDARAAQESRLVVVDNPARITSTALNRALERAHGAVIVRMDVHTTYADDYVAACLHALTHTGADCVGGAWRPVADEGDARQQAIARAFGSRFASGGAASRRVALDGEVDTVYLGAWQRETLQRLGGFDEALVRNQDDELALRIVRGGGRLWQSAAIRSWYRPRSSFGALYRQFWQYGYWKVAVIRKHRQPAAARHLVPFAFVATLAALAAAGVGWRPAWLALAGLVVLYAGAALGSAASVASPWREPRVWLGVALATALMHIGYGLGFARGLWDFLVVRRAPGVSATRLTR
ncbi:MAG: glycosyltransferase family 2 protein [Rubrivivax sp.]